MQGLEDNNAKKIERLGEPLVNALACIGHAWFSIMIFVQHAFSRVSCPSKTTAVFFDFFKLPKAPGDSVMSTKVVVKEATVSTRLFFSFGSIQYTAYNTITRSNLQRTNAFSAKGRGKSGPIQMPPNPIKRPCARDNFS